MKQLTLISCGFVIVVILMASRIYSTKNLHSSLDEKGVPTPVERVDFRTDLLMPSNLNAFGPDMNFEALIYGINDQFQWKSAVIIDDKNLHADGIQLSEIRFPGAINAGGVARRSSLRLVLDVVSVGYYVDDNNRIVVTTRRIARTAWLPQFGRPLPEDLMAKSVEVRRDAAFAIGLFSFEPKEWIPILLNALKDSDRDVLCNVIYAIGELGPQAANATDALIRILCSDDLTLRLAASNALAKIGPAASQSLLELIDDSDPPVAIAAISTIGMMGGSGNVVTAPLLAAGEKLSRKHDAEEVEITREQYFAVASAVSRIEMNDALPRLRELIVDGNAETRAYAAFTIGEIGPPARDFSQELQSLLADSAVTVRRNAAYALSRLNLPANTSTTALEAATQDTDHEVALWAAEALRVIRSEE